MLRRRFSCVLGGLLAGVITVFSVLPFMGQTRVYADGNYHAFNTAAPMDGCIMTVVEGTFDPVSADEILNLINSYRYEACAEGVMDPRDPSRNLTLDDYVPIRWSYELEQMAMLRAAEGYIYRDHTRPNGTRCFTAHYGVNSYNEVLAWYGGLISGIGGWYSEKADYVNQTGAVTGHYTAMINPGNTHCGISCFNGSAAGEFTNASYGPSGLDETKIDVSQYNGQYTEVNTSLITNINMTGDDFCRYNGGTARCSITFDFAYSDYWGRSREVTGLRYIAGGNWSSSDPSVASVSPDGTITGANAGTATIAFNCGSINLTKNISVVNGQPMFRVYNPNSGEHFYTSNEFERSNLISLGWHDEGIGWVAPYSSNTPVYRLYNENGGEHHYTTSLAERNNLISLGWNDEGIGWYSDDSQTVPLYRQYNPNAFANNHNYTTSLGENDWLVSLGWRAEGIGWYGVG